ncbi:MAG: hypothetical protein N2037_04170 [Acidimicrobiales bacterium]|nr:hypothetical protein [Acidimicrobiales bacterium]
MISTRGLTAFRVTAALCHSLPNLRARISYAGRALVHVLDPGPEEQLPDVGRVLSPCAFRCAVAQAYTRHQSGEKLGFLDLPAGTDPEIHIGTPTGGTARPGGIYRVPFRQWWLWGFATTVDPEVAFELGADLVMDAELGHVRALGIRPDAGLGVSLAFAETVAVPGSRDESVLVELLEALLARWTVHELMSAVDGSTSSTDSGEVGKW